jgi:hypothetical protein
VDGGGAFSWRNTQAAGNQKGDLGKIDVPVLVMHGTEDRVLLSSRRRRAFPSHDTIARWMPPRGAEVQLVSRWNAYANIGQPVPVQIPPGPPRQRPHSLFGKAGVVLGCWRLGTCGSEPSVRLKMPRFLRLGPSKILPGRLSSVCFEVQPRSGNVRSPNDPDSGRRSAQVRPPRCLTSFGRRTTFFYDYGPFGPAAIGLNEK